MPKKSKSKEPWVTHDYPNDEDWTNPLRGGLRGPRDSMYFPNSWAGRFVPNTYTPSMNRYTDAAQQFGRGFNGGSGPGSEASSEAETETSDPKYTPSSTLRELVIERLRQQRNCLIEFLQEHLGPLIKEGEDGLITGGSGKKGPGDQYIDAKQVDMLTKNTSPFGMSPLGPPRRSALTGFMLVNPAFGGGGNGLLQQYYDPQSMGSGFSRGLSRMPMRPRMPPDMDDMIQRRGVARPASLDKEGRCKDPMQRYAQLDVEINMLIGVAGGGGEQGQSEDGDLYMRRWPMGCGMAGSGKDRYKQLSKIIGTGESSSKPPIYKEKKEKKAGLQPEPAPALPVQQQYMQMPAPQVQSPGQGGYGWTPPQAPSPMQYQNPPMPQHPNQPPQQFLPQPTPFQQGPPPGMPPPNFQGPPQGFAPLQQQQFTGQLPQG